MFEVLEREYKIIKIKLLNKYITNLVGTTII